MSAPQFFTISEAFTRLCPCSFPLGRVSLVFVGTRADFFVGDDWVGSLRADGDPDVLRFVTDVTDDRVFRRVVGEVLERAGGFWRFWPWPYDTPRDTDYCYVFDPLSSMVLVAHLGRGWVRGVDARADTDWSACRELALPDMSGRRKRVRGQTQLGVSMPRQLRSRVEAAADRLGWSKAQFVRWSVVQGLELASAADFRSENMAPGPLGDGLGEESG